MRLLKWLIRTVVFIGLAVAVTFGLLFLYFRIFNNVGQRVQRVVMHDVAVRHEHYMTYNQIPTVFRNAMIATEDRRFFTDPGIDPIGIMRSFIVDVEKDGYVEGGSTITQQLVDNSIIVHRKTIPYKITQAFYAIGIYDTQSKPETFALYANAIYFGAGAYGLYDAAETYFGKTPSQLNDGELTMLAGLPNLPSLFDPFIHLKLARQRQAIVLQNMVDDGLITSKQSSAIYREPIRLK